MLWGKGPVLCSIFPARQAETCVANQREVKEMWEPYSWGSLTTIKTNIKKAAGSHSLLALEAIWIGEIWFQVWGEDILVL